MAPPQNGSSRKGGLPEIRDPIIIRRPNCMSMNAQERSQTNNNIEVLMTTERSATHASLAGLFATNPAPAFNSPGVILMTRQQDIVYINPQATLLLERLGKPARVRPSSQRHPSALLSLCAALHSKLARSLQDGRWWDDVLTQAVVMTPTGAILLRGLVLPADDAVLDHRFLVLLECVPCETPQSAAEPADDLPFLSHRQHAIAKGLSRGLTNKQLASELQISPHTVKEYIRALMLKVKAPNRAGIVAQLFQRSDTLSASAKTKQL